MPELGLEGKAQPEMQLVVYGESILFHYDAGGPMLFSAQ